MIRKSHWEEPENPPVQDDVPTKAAIAAAGAKFKAGHGWRVAVRAALEAADAARATPIEIRRNEDGSLDEVVADNCMFHLEQMDDNHWWMAVYVGESQVSVHLSARGNIVAMVEDDRLPTPPKEAKDGE